MDDFSELKADIKELKGMTLDLVKQGARHNVLLEQHEARSLALQSAQEKLDVRLEPVEDHVKIINRVGKVIGAILVGLIIQIAVKKLIGLI